MKEWFDSLEPRERWMVGGTGLLLLIVILYVGIVEPVLVSAAERSVRVEQKRADLADVRAIADEIEQLRGGDAAPRTAGSESLITLINRTAREFGLGTPARTQPAGQDVRVTFRDQPFDKLVQWLDTLEQRHGLSIGQAQFDRTTPGVVNATLTLERR